MESAESSSQSDNDFRLKSRRGFFLLFAAAQVSAVASIILTIVWCTQYLGGFDWSTPHPRFNYHTLLMVIAFVFLYGNGMLIYRLMRNEPKLRLKLLHAILNGLAFLVSVAGFVAVYSFTDMVGNVHFYTLHTWIGTGTMILFTLNLLSGIVFFLLPIKLSDQLRGLMLPLHVYGGQASLFLIVASILTGIVEHEMFRYVKLTPAYNETKDEVHVYAPLGITIVMFGLIAGFLITKPDYQRQPLPSETSSLQK